MRIRTVKPEFFLNEELSMLSPLHRLAFVGLWCCADKVGRIEDRPTRLKVQLFPYENVDLETVLNELHAADFIVRYSVGTENYIEIKSFKKHQRPHPKEAESEFPGPEVGIRREIKRPAVKEFPMSLLGDPCTPGEGKGREGKEILDNGKEISVSPPKGDGAQKKKPDPRHPPTLKALTETFEKIKGTKYPFHVRDLKAVSSILVDPEMTPTAASTAFERALKNTGYPTVSNIFELSNHFAHFVGTKPVDVRKGVVNAEDMGWDKTGGTHDVHDF